VSHRSTCAHHAHEHIVEGSRMMIRVLWGTKQASGVGDGSWQPSGGLGGPEFVGTGVLRWVTDEGIVTAQIAPGKPWQNGIDESFDGRFRDELHLSPSAGR
jgi:hypothetical protein